MVKYESILRLIYTICTFEDYYFLNQIALYRYGKPLYIQIDTLKANYVPNVFVFRPRMWNTSEILHKACLMGHKYAP